MNYKDLLFCSFILFVFIIFFRLVLDFSFEVSSLGGLISFWGIIIIFKIRDLTLLLLDNNNEYEDK